VREENHISVGCPSCGSHAGIMYTGSAGAEDKFWHRYFPELLILENGDDDY
jgi:hypothetical protein